MAIRIETTTSRILVVGTPYLHKDILKAIAGARWDKDRRCWTYPLSPSVALALHSLYPAANTDSGFLALMDSAKKNEHAVTLKSASEENLPPVPSTTLKPWLHQLRSYHFAKQRLALDSTPIGGSTLLGLDMGTGKTKVVYDLINNHPHIQTVLVTCPKPVIQTWQDEAAKHKINRNVLTLLLGDRVTRNGSRATWHVAKRTLAARSFLEQHFGNQETCRVVVINHESAWREPFRSFVKERVWDLLVVDECHRAKSAGGKFSTFLGKSIGNYATRIGLTGTPMPKDPMDIYAQARFLDPGIYGTSYAKFKARYGVWGGFENRKFLRLRNEEEFTQKLDSFMIRVKADDVLDLPPQIHESRYCVLDAKESSAYRSMKDDLIADLESGVVTAANALVKLLRLQQIVQGTIRDDNGVTNRIGETKQELLRELLEDLHPSEPVVIFARFTDDLDRIHQTCEDLGRGSLELSGKVDQLREWKDGDAPILAAQIQAGGVGVDLSRSHYTVYYSPTFDMGSYEQSLKRTHRPGQTRTTFYYHLLARGTIDTKIHSALKSKKNTVEAALEGIL